MSEKLEKKMTQVKNSKSRQSVPNKKNYEQTTSRIQTPKHVNDEDGEINASDNDTKKTEHMVILSGHRIWTN